MVEEQFLPESVEVTRMLHELRDQPKLLDEKLYPVLYDAMRRIAASHMRKERDARTLQPTVLVHEAYMRLVRSSRKWENKAQFLYCASHVMRQILVEYARRRNSRKRGSGAVQVPLEDRAAERKISPEDVLAIEDSLQRLERLDPRKARLLRGRFYGDMTIPELSDVFGLAESTVKMQLRSALAWINADLTGTNKI
jgi:RNA polymerase sigma factor (TIGR02999 family)